MKHKGVRRLTVVDRKQATVGMLSADDLARCLHNLISEVLEVAALNGKNQAAWQDFYLQLTPALGLAAKVAGAQVNQPVAAPPPHLL